MGLADVLVIPAAPGIPSQVHVTFISISNSARGQVTNDTSSFPGSFKFKWGSNTNRYGGIYFSNRALAGELENGVS